MLRLLPAAALRILPYMGRTPLILLLCGCLVGLRGPAASLRSVGGFYAAPGGTAAGDGTRARPWDLATALAGGRGAVGAGDTIWLRGGTYAGTFEARVAGTSAAPVIVRQYPGERATIDGSLHARGAFVTYWGFEITQSNPVANGKNALETYGPNCRFVNLIVHDAGAQGVSFWETEGTAELYGSIIYDNGTHPGLDHGIYAANDGGEKWIVDNVVFDNLAYGIHVYAGPRHPVLTDVHVRGNVAFATGLVPDRGWLANVLVGGAVRTQRMTVDSNLLYFPDSAGLNMRLGQPRGDNRDIVVRANYVAGGAAALFMQQWAQAEVAGNHLIGPAAVVDLRVGGAPPSASWRWSGNTYYRDSAAKAWRYQGDRYDLRDWQAQTGLGATGIAAGAVPAAPRVFVRPNRYEPGRATVVIYNWSRQDPVAVDLSGVVQPGAHYEVRSVERIFGTPMAEGSYAGGPISIPMAPIAPPRPIAHPGWTRQPSGPAFGVFIVTSSNARQGRRPP